MNLSGVNLSSANLFGANLSGVDLSCVNLSDADLSGANLFGVNFNGFQFTGLEYQLIFWKNQIQIGCEIHNREKWEKFTDKEILRMDGKKGLEWWEKNKKFVFSLSDKLLKTMGGENETNNR